MLWVIIGHSFSFFINGGVENITHLDVPAAKPFFLIIEGGLLSVDIFLMLGGFFLAFVMLRSKISAKICGLGIVQRAFRIWPAYLLAMMFYYSLFMKLGSGPFWSRAWTDAQKCSTMWR
jgi:peptidoglycan/LPS O-acetylase OafA/YrhL